MPGPGVEGEKSSYTTESFCSPRETRSSRRTRIKIERISLGGRGRSEGTRSGKPSGSPTRSTEGPEDEENRRRGDEENRRRGDGRRQEQTESGTAMNTEVIQKRFNEFKSRCSQLFGPKNDGYEELDTLERPLVSDVDNPLYEASEDGAYAPPGSQNAAHHRLDVEP